MGILNFLKGLFGNTETEKKESPIVETIVLTPKKAKSTKKVSAKPKTSTTAKAKKTVKK